MAAARSPHARINMALAILAAALGWAALGLQFKFQVGDFYAAGGSALTGALRFFGFFTIWGNLLAALVVTQAAVRPASRRGLTAPRTELAAATAMVVVDSVNALILRQGFAPHGIRGALDVALHDVLPLIFVLWWLTRPHRVLRLADALSCLVLPSLYCIVALVRGAVEHWYPYPFLDADRLAPVRLGANIVALALLFGVIGTVFAAIDRGLSRFGRSSI